MDQDSNKYNKLHLSKHGHPRGQGESMVFSVAHSNPTLASPNIATKAPIICPKTSMGVNRSRRPTGQVPTPRVHIAWPRRKSIDKRL